MSEFNKKEYSIEYYQKNQKPEVREKVLRYGIEEVTDINELPDVNVYLND